MNSSRLPLPAIVYVVLSILLALALTAAPIGAQANGLVPFECDGDAYTVRDSPADLFRINQDVMPFTFEKIADMQGPFGPDGALIDIQVNNIGFAPGEDVIYGVAIPARVPIVNTNFGIVKIDALGQVAPVPTALPRSPRFLAGDVSTDGSTMYLNAYPSGANMFVVDLDTLALTTVPLSGGPVNVADWAYNPLDGNLYGAVGRGPTAPTGAPVYKLDPISGVISLVGYPPGLPLANSGDAQYYGGAWFTPDGMLAVYRNSDWIYEIDLSVPGLPVIVADFEGDAGPSTFNDAAACLEDPGIEKFYTHTNNDWSLRCVTYVEDVCVEWRQPNVEVDDDIFAMPLDQNEDGQFVLYGMEGKKKTVVTPGQYIAVSNVTTLSTQDVLIKEDFSDCTDIGTVNPFKVPGGVQVVLVDPLGDVYDIDDDLADGIGGWIELTENDALVYVEDVPAQSTLRVMVKFQPSSELGIIGDSCINEEIICDPGAEPCEEVRAASAGLIIQ